MHQNKNQNKNKQHEPVLLSEVIDILRPNQGENYLDLTAGYGGHAQKILDLTGSLTNSVLVDRDQNATSELQKLFPSEISIWHDDYLSASQKLVKDGRSFDLILADLGVSSPHLNNSSRGFSFSENGPLDMRMDQSQKLTAWEVVNSYNQDKLMGIIRKYGEDPKAKALAETIVDHRPINSTAELADLATKVWILKGKTHPATRLFQAIRIEVNNEIGLLEQSLPLWIKLLSPGGRIAIISFHSLEDRLVKNALKNDSGGRLDSKLRLINPKPIVASADEIVLNPRARSAKLRAAVKIKT